MAGPDRRVVAPDARPIRRPARRKRGSWRHSWFELFQDMVGSDPATVPRFRLAVESEPVLQMGRGMTDEMIDFLRSAQPVAQSVKSVAARNAATSASNPC